MINSVLGPLLPSNGLARPAVNLGKGTVMPLTTLTKGQLMEGVVVQLQPRLLVETPANIFSAAANAGAHKLGERLLFKVVDPDSRPPRLELLRPGQLARSSVLEQNVFLRSLLYRPDSLAPLQKWLSGHLSVGLSNLGSKTKMPTALSALLNEFWQLPSNPKALDIKKTLLMSGLFSESRGHEKTRARSIVGPAKPNNDLKSLLQLVALEEDFDHETKPLLEALHSSQIKALNALVNNQVYYQWLMPWFDQQYLMITLQQNEQQLSQKKWSISLAHQGPELGNLQINLLLTQAVDTNEATASLHFASNTLWLAPLVNSSKQQLNRALQTHGIHLQHVSVGPLEDNDAKDRHNPPHAILDVHV